MDNIRDKVSNEMKAELGELLRSEYSSLNDTDARINVNEGIYAKYVKRSLDILFSSAALGITLPVNVIIGIVTFFDVGVPLFFKQRRAGKDGKIFEIVKFRNMKNTVDEDGILLPANKRVTKWGKFVRKTSLDELLNFWPVLKGDMSLIGPRPLPETYIPRYSKRHIKRLAVRPGLECPPRNIETYDGSWQQRFENDLWYVENLSFRTDCLMVIRLFQFAFNKKFSGNRGAAAGGAFIGYDDKGKAINLNEVPDEYIVRILKKHNISV